MLMFFFTGFKTSLAQYNYSRVRADKYEIAIDLQHFFSDGYPDKVLFKINNIKENQIKGAYRFGLGASYWIDKYKITQDNKNYELTAKNHQTNFSLSVGYEFQKNLNKAVFYYGTDLGGFIGITDDMDFPNVDEYYNFFIVPFTGIKVLLSQSLSIAFEAGIKNFYQWSKSEGSNVSPDNRQYHSFYQSKLELPYSLTFNFNF
jgi:hypothetical protein